MRAILTSDNFSLPGTLTLFEIINSPLFNNPPPFKTITFPVPLPFTPSEQDRMSELKLEEQLKLHPYPYP